MIQYHSFFLLQNWEYFLKHMNKKQYCIEKSNIPKSTHSITGGNKVYIPAQLSFQTETANISNIQGSIPISK